MEYPYQITMLGGHYIWFSDSTSIMVSQRQSRTPSSKDMAYQIGSAGGGTVGLLRYGHNNMRNELRTGGLALVFL